MRPRNPLHLASLCAALLLGSACNEFGRDEPAEAEKEKGAAEPGAPATQEPGVTPGKAGQPTERGEGYAAFEAKAGESGAAFAARADAALSRLEADLANIRQKQGEQMTDQARTQMQQVESTIQQAKQNLDQIRAETATEVTPQREQIASHINEAQRQMGQVRSMVTEKKM